MQGCRLQFKYENGFIHLDVVFCTHMAADDKVVYFQYLCLLTRYCICSQASMLN